MIRFQDGQNGIEVSGDVLSKGFRGIKPSSGLTKVETQDFWNDVFGVLQKKKEISFEDIVVDIYGRDEGEFTFNIDVNREDIRNALDNFRGEVWNELSEKDRFQAVSNFERIVGDMLDISKTPKICYYEDEEHPCNCGYYAPYENEIRINKINLNNPQEIIDTVAHEMRHAFQFEHAEKLETYYDFLYAYNCANYIVPEETADGYINFIDYQDQLIEAEARAFASMFVIEEGVNE